MKTSPVGAELFHADGRTDMKKLTVVLHNCASARSCSVTQNTTVRLEDREDHIQFVAKCTAFSVSAGRTEYGEARYAIACWLVATDQRDLHGIIR